MAVVAYALRRTSARVVLAVGAFGLLWTVGVMEGSIFVGGTGASPIPIPRGPWHLLGSGFSPWDVAAAVLVAAVAAVAAVALYRDRSGR